MRLLVVILLAQCLSAQVLLTVTPKGRAYDKLAFGGLSRNKVMAWDVELASNEAEALDVQESLIRPYAIANKVLPYTHLDLAMLILSSKQNSWWFRLTGASEDVGRLGALVMASKLIKVRETWPLALVTGAPVAIQYFAGRIKGSSVPIESNFEQLAWGHPVHIEANGRGNAVIFSQVYKEPQSFSVVIPAAGTAKVRSLR